MRKVLSVLMPLEWLVVIFGVLALGLYYLLELPLPNLYAALNLPLPHLSSAEAASGSTQDVASASSATVKFLLPFLLLFTLSIENYAFILLVFFAWSGLEVLLGRGGDRGRVSWARFGSSVLGRVSLAQIFQDFRFLSAMVLVFAEFAVLKNLTPRVNSVSWDSWLVESDKLLCGGKMCSEILLGWFGVAALDAISDHYIFFLRYVSLVATFFVVAAPRRTSQQFLFAITAAYLFGILWVYGMPSTGPTFVNKELYAFLADHKIGKLQQGLLVSQNEVYLISGLPSLHVAIVMIGSIFLWKISRLLGAASWVFFVLTLNSTVYLGWHYLLDDVAAIFLALAVVWLAKRCAWEWRGFSSQGLFLGLKD